MDRVKVFIGYSSEQKSIGGKFKSFTEDYCGYKVFIAHDDIPGSFVWEDEIIKAIEKADIFIPLISEGFAKSPFADQETGIAVYLKKKIIPIKLDSANPYGFISKYQALQYKKYPPGYSYKDNINELAISIAQVGLSYDSGTRLHKKAINSIVYAFCNSGSFYASNATINSMIKCRDFSRSHLKQIKKAIKINNQIQGAFELPTLKRFLLGHYKLAIDSILKSDTMSMI